MVVEHDEDTIRRAAHLIDIGPGAGVRGGRVVAQGSVDDLIDAPGIEDGRVPEGAACAFAVPRRPVVRSTPRIAVRDARMHNLRHVDAGFRWNG